MDTMALMVLLLLGQATLLVLAEEYHLVTEQKTWIEAQQHCRTYFTDLASIHNEEDWFKVKKLVDILGSYAWIGLYDDINSWRWTIDNSFVYDGDTTFSGIRAFSWADNHLSNHKCGSVSKGVLDDRKCTLGMMSVCYDAQNDSYIIITTARTWQNALDHCRQTYTDLANMRNVQEETAVMSVINITKDYWIGMTRDSWEWSDQSDVTFTKWVPGEPNSGSEDCVVAIADGWNDGTCGSPAPFICSGPSKKVLNVVLKAAPSVDLNDPKIQESILNYLEKQLRDQQITSDFKLTWMTQPNGKVFNRTNTQ